MKRTALFVALASVLLLAVDASRLDPYNEVQISTSADGYPLRGSAQALLNIMRGKGKKGQGTEEDLMHMPMFTIKFFVPPSESSSFEKRFMEFSDDVNKDEKPEMFTLKKTQLTNTLYYSYAEFNDMQSMHDHFTTNHFEDFANWVDDHGIKWELELLKSLSTDIDKEQQKKKHMEVDKRKKKTYDYTEEIAHILIQYYVPPGEHDKFVDAWMECAKNTIKEDENQVYSLRKTFSDNTRFWVYGTWESFNAYMEHYNSKHLGKLIDYTNDNDITWFITPLEEVGGDAM